VHVLAEAVDDFTLENAQLARISEDLEQNADDFGKFKHHGNW